MLASLLEMGKSIVSWPQLGGAALLNGIGVAYCARKVLTKSPLERNRAILSLDEKLTPDHDAPEQLKWRSAVQQDFAQKLGL